MSTIVNIIGMGEIGSNVYDAMKERGNDIELVGTEINPQRVQELKKKRYNVGPSIHPKADIYIIAVYLTEQVFDVLDKIQLDMEKERPLVSIESTIHPNAVTQLKNYQSKMDIVLFPHRYNPNDNAHHVFNIARIMGGVTESGTNRAFQFFKDYMLSPRLIHVFPIEIVNLSKPMENAYRFMEIIIAQEMKMACDYYSVDFETLRRAMNTKWNIGVRESRNGIGGVCLPKDMGLIADYFDMFPFFDDIYQRNEAYKRYVKNKETK